MSSLSQSRKRATLAFILVTVLLDVIALGIVVPVFPHIIEGFIGSTANASILNGIFVGVWAFMQLFSSPILGSLSDRFGRRPVILISTLGLSIDYILVAIAPNLWWLLVARILGGLTSASIGAVYAYMADITPEEDRAKSFGLIGAAFSLGFIIGPVLGGFLGDISLRAPFWFASLLSALAFLYGLFVLPESLSHDNRMAFSWKRANPLGALKLLLQNSQLATLGIITFIIHFCSYVFHAIFVLYTAHRFGFTMKEFGLVLAMTALLDALVQALLVAPCVKRFNNEGTLIIGLVIGAIGTIALGLAPNRPMFMLALVVQALWGLATPTTLAIASSLVPPNQQGQLQGANMSLAAIAGIFAPITFGGVYALFISRWAHFNLAGAPFILAGTLLLTSAMLACVSIRTSIKA